MSNVLLMENEARKFLIDQINGMDIDDLAVAVSELGIFEDSVVIVRSNAQRMGRDGVMRHTDSYSYHNGMSNNERGVFGFNEEKAT